MNADSRRTHALAILKKTGMWRSNYEPPLLRALWHLGLDIRPPHFVPFSLMVILAMAWFSTVWGTCMWLLVWSQKGLSGSSAIGLACATGLLFGLVIAGYYAHGRKKHQLPAWSSL